MDRQTPAEPPEEKNAEKLALEELGLSPLVIRKLRSGQLDPGTINRLFGDPERDVMGCSELTAAMAGNALTGREIDVLCELLTGSSDERIASRLGVKVSTVRCHVKHLLEKTGLPSRTSLALQMMKLLMTPLRPGGGRGETRGGAAPEE